VQPRRCLPEAHCLRGLAIASFEARKFVDAYRAFREMSKAETLAALPADVRRDVERMTKESYERTAHIEPNARVSIDGKDVGLTPLREPFDIEAGRHVVELSGGASGRVEVDAGAGQVTRAHFANQPSTTTSAPTQPTEAGSTMKTPGTAGAGGAPGSGGSPPATKGADGVAAGAFQLPWFKRVGGKNESASRHDWALFSVAMVDGDDRGLGSTRARGQARDGSVGMTLRYGRRQKAEESTRPDFGGRTHSASVQRRPGTHHGLWRGDRFHA
jgi:hypothetical protein